MTDHAADAMAWIARHPDAFALFERLSLQAAFKRKAFGFKAVAEVVRWQFYYERDADEDWKLNNNHVTHLGREVLERHPWVAQFVQTRKAGNDNDLF